MVMGGGPGVGREAVGGWEGLCGCEGRRAGRGEWLVEGGGRAGEAGSRCEGSRVGIGEDGWVGVAAGEGHSRQGGKRGTGGGQRGGRVAGRGAKRMDMEERDGARRCTDRRREGRWTGRGGLGGGGKRAGR